jgi:hypothetical protein
MNSATQTWRPALRDDLSLQRVDDDLLVIDGEKESVIELKGVSTFILERCDGERTVDDIVSDIVDRYPVSKQRATEDTEALLEEMRTLGIVN